MRHVVLMPFGSAGDVFPFIWIAKLLKARGHRVTMVTTCRFADAARAAGIDFVGLGTIEEVDAIGMNRRIWKPGIGTKVVFDYAVKWSEEYLETMRKLGKVDLIMAPLTAFGARMAREKYGLPLVTVHLQPLVFVSAHEAPLLHPLLGWIRAMPVWAKRFLFSLPNAIDLLALPGIRKICDRHGIKPPKSLWREWWDSPDGVLALFPEWLAKPQPDWPENLLQWDFPMEDLGAEMPMQSELEEFLAAGDKPVVFTPGSANVQAELFFETAVEAVKRLGIRAVFVTRMENRVPPDMADRIMRVDFVPFSKLLEHASAFVHHGGIGTMAQGFRAGVPQLIMAMAHDQPDNANRLEKLGAGIGLTPGSFTPGRVTKELGRLLAEETWRKAAAEVKGWMGFRKDLDALSAWVERRMRE